MSQPSVLATINRIKNPLSEKFHMLHSA